MTHHGLSQVIFFLFIFEQDGILDTWFSVSKVLARNNRILIIIALKYKRNNLYLKIMHFAVFSVVYPLKYSSHIMSNLISIVSRSL
jgi:hypothetical protein